MSLQPAQGLRRPLARQDGDGEVLRRGTHAKVLPFDGSGLCIYAKRLERGRFAKLWRWSERKQLALKPSELQLFLEGSDLVGRFRVSPDRGVIERLAEHAEDATLSPAAAEAA